MNKNCILLIEDDPLQAESIKRAVERHFRNLRVEVTDTESEFRQRLPSLIERGCQPKFVITDAMFPWAYADPGAPPAPEDVRIGTFSRAGLRCWEQFRRYDVLKTVPWVYFTVLEKNAIEFSTHRDDYTQYVQKSGSIQPLLDELDKISDPAWSETEDEVTEKFMGSHNMRAILLAGMQTPLKDCTTALP